MDKTLTLRILMLLSALESWSYATSKPIPDRTLAELEGVIDALKDQLMGGA